MVLWLMRLFGIVPKQKDVRKLPDIEAYFKGNTLVVKEKRP